MAYGQTGTGKTYTLGRLGEEDAADRGIMLRAMEDILAEVSPENDSISVSYLQVLLSVNIFTFPIGSKLHFLSCWVVLNSAVLVDITHK